MILGVIQARMKSTRLPGKVAMMLECNSILARVILQARRCRMIDWVVVVTSQENADNQVARIGNIFGGVVRTNRLLPDGTNDVLAWFRHALAEHPQATHIVRITADCPFWCPLLSAEVIAHHIAHGRYYTSNVHQSVDGFDTEVFTREALERADLEAVDCYDRHHVTPWMRRSLPTAWVDHRELVGGAKLSIDTQEDFDRCRTIAEELEQSDRAITSHSVMDVFRQKGYPLCSDMQSPSPTSSEPPR